MHLLECWGEEDANRRALLPSRKRSTHCPVQGQGGLGDLRSASSSPTEAWLPASSTQPFPPSWCADLFAALIWPFSFFDRDHQIPEEGEKKPKSKTKSNILILTICLNLHWSCFGDPGNLSFLFTFSVCSSNRVLFA